MESTLDDVLRAEANGNDLQENDQGNIVVCGEQENGVGIPWDDEAGVLNV